MSKKFVVEDSVVNPNSNAVYKMDNDLVRGFKLAVRNSQPVLALQYLMYIVDVLDADEPVKEEVTDKLATSRKVGTKTKPQEAGSEDEA